MVYHDIVDKVKGELNQLTQLHVLHLTSIAKAIELSATGRMRIIFRGRPKDILGMMSPGLMLTQKITADAPGCKGPFAIYEHFIYYDTDAPILKTRFTVAHELAHILLHDPTGKKGNDREYVRFPHGSKEIFVVKYTKDEEMEADMLASILYDQRPLPLRPTEFYEPCIRKLKKISTDGFFRSELYKILPTNMTCIR